MSKVGFTCGAFDLLHAGHIVMLKEAKENCDWLIVGLQTDPTLDRDNKNHPVQSMYERFIQLRAVRYVDEILPYDTELSLTDLLQSTHIDIRFVGDDYKDRGFTGMDISRESGEIYYTSRAHSFSTSGLRDRVASKPHKTDRRK
jgi:glycerol-3-phosphate cytidylyltransferase